MAYKVLFYYMERFPSLRNYLFKEFFNILKADPEFGTNVDWEELFYDTLKELVIAPDGSIYVVNGKQHNIFKFSKDGQFLAKFGQYGQGPLDFVGPGEPSILDNKYLVVGEYALNRRITLVDMAHIDTRHVKVLKTQHKTISPMALKNNKIAYTTWRFEPLSKSEQKRITDVIIKDVTTGKETVIATYEYFFSCRTEYVQVHIMMAKSYFWDVYIERTKNGNLLVGASNNPNIDIFSVEGEKIKSFSLDYHPIKVTDELQEEIKERLARSMGVGRKNVSELVKGIRNAIRNSKLLGDHLPYYDHIMVDSVGNILVFPNTDCRKDCEIRFRVYSPEGRYICNTKINTGNFKFKIDKKRKQIVFTEQGIFGLFELKDSEDVSLRLVRVKLETK